MHFICSAQGVALLQGVTLWEWVCHCGHGFKALILAAWGQCCPSSLQMKHAYMLPCSHLNDNELNF